MTRTYCRSAMGMLSAAAVAIAASCAAAQTSPTPDPLAGFYGNTLKIEVQHNKQLRFFEPDHTYRDRIHGNVVSGTWAIEDERICTQVVHGSKYCNLGLGKAVGETWLDKDPYTGNEVKFTLIAGRKDDR